MESRKINKHQETSEFYSSPLVKFLKPKLDKKLTEINKNNNLNNFDLKWINKEINKENHVINIDELFTWVLKQVEYWKEFHSLMEIKSQIESNDVTIIGFFSDKNSSDIKIFQEVADNYEDHLFGIVSNQQLFNNFNAKDGTIIMFKKFDESQLTFEDEITVDGLENFIDIHSLPLIIHYNSKYCKNIYSSGYENHLYICKSKNDDDFNKFIDGITESAKEFRGKMMFVIFDYDNDNEMNFLSNSLNIEREDLPLIIFDGIFGKERLLHKPDNPDVSVENIKEFIVQFHDDGLIKLVLEEQLPSDWDKELVKIVAGGNFAEVVLNENKHVVVLFYHPEKHLHLELIMLELAEEFEDYDDIGFAKLNLTANNLEVATSSTDADISLYKKGTNENIIFFGKQIKSELREFIKSFLNNSSFSDCDGTEV